ncbi:MAG: isoprenylcysteine carboxylmethyltransferase family protein [Bryobacteraceae bacterium]
MHRLPAYSVAAAAGVLGAGSLALFGMFLWTGASGIVEMGMSAHATLAWDAGLCLLFFVQHSVMVRKWFRARMGRVVAEKWHGVIYTMASAAALLLLAGLWQRSSTVIYWATGAWREMARAVLLLSLAGVLWGIRSLGEFDAFGIEALLSREGRPPGKLTIAGPYRWLRHPFYAFGIVAAWAGPVLSLDRLLFNILFTGWVLLGAALEERDLVAVFEDGYRQYQRTVPMFVPRRPRPKSHRAAAG